MNVKQLYNFVFPIVKQATFSILRKFLNYYTLPTVKQFIVLSAVRIVGFYLSLLRLTLLLWAWLTSNERKYFWTAKERTSPPSCLLQSSLGRHRYAQLRDIKLHYVESGNPKNPLLLCLHGFPEVWYSWKYQLRAFSKTHWVVAVDMRGYGDSEKPRSANQYHLHIIVEDIRQLISKLGKESCVLIGHDWGAAIGWLIASIHPNLLNHYVALSFPHPSVFRYYLTHTLKQCFLSRHLFLFQTPYIPELVLQSQDNLAVEKMATAGTSGQDSFLEIEAYKYYFSKPGAWKGPLNYYRQIFSSSSLAWMSQAQLRVRLPTMLIFGKADPFFDQRMIPRCYEHVDQFQYHIIDDASHWIQREAPEEINAIIAKFLNVTL